MFIFHDLIYMYIIQCTNKKNIWSLQIKQYCIAIVGIPILFF